MQALQAGFWPESSRLAARMRHPSRGELENQRGREYPIGGHDGKVLSFVCAEIMPKQEPEDDGDSSYHIIALGQAPASLRADKAQGLRA